MTDRPGFDFRGRPLTTNSRGLDFPRSLAGEPLDPLSKQALALARKILREDR